MTDTAAFATVVLDLLTRRAMTTLELYVQVSAICPDRCQDQIMNRWNEPVWKHRMRSAQNHLQECKLISLNRTTKKWSAVNRLLTVQDWLLQACTEINRAIEQTAADGTATARWANLQDCKRSILKALSVSV